MSQDDKIRDFPQVVADNTQPETRNIVTFEVTYRNALGDTTVEYFDGYATVQSATFAIQDEETHIPLIILPIAQLLKVTSSSTEVPVDTDGTPTIN